MKYALGNMLNGAGGLNADKLALDLQFAADKTLTARKGPTPILTRAQTTSTGSTYVGSDGLIKYAAQNEPRFDHNPVSPFACRGLLIEEGRTNFLRGSSRIDTSPWGQSGSSTVATGETAPDGSFDGALITTTAINNGRSIGGLSLTAATAYSVSCYFKAGTANAVRFSFFDGSGALVVALNLSTLVVSTVSGALPYTSSVTIMPNGWYRFAISITAPVTTAGAVVAIQSGAPGSFIAWGAQLEAGSFPTSYIPTTTSALARSADVCSIANTSSFWNGSEFTLFTNANWAAAGFDSYALNFSITAGFFGARRPNTNLAAGIIRSSGVNADMIFGTNGSFTTGSMRMALAHSTGQQAGSLNGATAIQQNSAFVPSSNPPLNIGYSGAGAYINGHIAAISYYKKRLANAKLQALTA